MAAAHGSGRFEDGVSSFRQLEIVGAALEEGESKGFLQHLDAPRDGGLALAERLGGAVHRSMSHHGEKDPKVVPGRFGEGEAEGIERRRSHVRMLKR
jgi:hypothetical protein